MLFDAALGSKAVQGVLTPQKAGSHGRDIAAPSALPHLSEVQYSHGPGGFHLISGTSPSEL